MTAPGAPTPAHGGGGAREEVLEAVLPGRHDPLAVFRELARDHRHLVWDDRAGAPAFIGLPGPTSTVLVLERDGIVRRAPADDAVLERVPGADLPVLAAMLRRDLAAAGAGSAELGWWGWIGYEASPDAARFEPEAGAPLASLLRVERGVRIDPASGTAVLVVLSAAPDAQEWLARTAQRLAAIPPDPAAPDPADRGTAGPPAWTWRHDRTEYLRMIEQCIASITHGDAYQLCLTDRIDVVLPPTDPVRVYARLRALNPAPHGGVVRSGEHWLLCGSPEQYLRVSASGRASTSPIKGTRRRGADAAEDLRLVAELRASEKERAENLMIVDLMRNDLSRVATVGSVEVTRLFEVETYRTVHQLVSTVEADLAEDGIAAALALFPAGSMTGAPKRSAMTILAGLERGARGAYSGCWGRFALDGSVDLAVVIRTIALAPGRASIGTGGGITALSDPAEEWLEIELKARTMLAALAGA